MTEEIPKEFYAQMNSLAYALDVHFNGKQAVDDRSRKVGFMLLTFLFGDDKEGRVNLISNCEREDSIATMKAYIAHHEGHLMKTPSTVQ